MHIEKHAKYGWTVTTLAPEAWIREILGEDKINASRLPVEGTTKGGSKKSINRSIKYGFHHQSEDGKYLIMGNGTDAFAIPAQQESPIKAAEMTTEQNYNMIDGVLNNAPTMSELEAKAKAGEQISLFDVAEAAKAEARKPKQPQRPAQKQKKPSIRAQLKAAKEEQQKKPPQREKTQELEV